MRKYLYIFAAATLLSMSGCTSYDEELLPSTDSSSDIDSPVVRLDNGKTGVYLNFVPKSSETIAVTRSEASGTELNIADGYAFVFKAAKPTVFDPTNSDGYGHSSILLEITDLTINANNVAFFTFDQYPWVKTAGVIDYTRYGAIVDYNFFVDDGGYPILTDINGTCNYYYNAEGKYYAPHVYDSDGDEVEPNGVDKTTYAVSLPDPDDTEDNTATGLIPEGLYLIYCYTDSDSCDGYYINKNTSELTINANGVTDNNGNTILASDLRNTYSTLYKYTDPKYTDTSGYMNNPIVGINPMCFVRFMVNLTDGTTVDVKNFITQRMVNGGTTGTVTTFEDYKHLSVGLDAYYQVEIDETDLTEDALLTNGTPNPQGTITDGSLTEKYPMASPGIEMAYGLNEYTLYTLDENDKIELIQVGAKVDVQTDDGDFSLIGVTLLNGAKRALMRSSVIDITGIGVDETLISLPLPTNLHYEYRPASDLETEIDWRNGTIQYNEVLANDSEDGVYTYHNTKDYPIYFFPNEGDYPQNTDAGSAYDYSLSHYLAEDFDGISDPVNGFNPTYLIVRGFIAKYHDRNGNGVYDAISSNGTVTDDVGYYKVPIKYESTVDNDYYTYDIVRCNYYTVRLTSVNNAGYKTFEEAAAGPASDIAYDIAIGGTSDDRNEYATSGGTFYLETDANDIFIKGYDYSDDFEATFDVTLVDNEYDADTELLTKAADPAYETPLLYLTVTDGITITGYDVKDGASNNITADSSTSTTYVYEIEAGSGNINTIRFQATKSGVIYVQAGDVMKQINVYYEKLAYQTAGDMTYDTTTGDYVANTYGFNVDGAYAFEDPATKASTGINTIEYDDTFYADEDNFGNANDKTAEQEKYSQFISLEGRVNDNRYAKNGYTNGSYYGHYLNRECRAKAYRSGGYGIAKIYLKQATDFGLLLGDGSDSDAYVATETNITYTSRGYIYDLSFSDDGGVSTNGSMGYNNNTGTITYSYTSGGADITRTIADGSTTNNPLLFYAAGDPDQVDLMTVTSVVNEGVNTITNEYIYDTDDGDDDEKTVIGYTGYNFCSGGLEGDIEGYDPLTADGNTYRYVANNSEIDIRSNISQIDIGEGFSSWYDESTNAGEKFTLWAYPILRNQGTDFDYETAGSEWSYIEGTSFLDDVVTVTMTNIAGEVKEYVFNLKQYALPFWDPTLSAEESLYSSVTGKQIDYVTCNLPADSGYSGAYNSNYTNYTPYDSSVTNNEFIGAFVVYNCIYDNGNDFRWANTNNEFSVTTNSNVQDVVPVQAFDYNEPDYVVFAPHVNANSNTYTNNNATTGTDYMVLTMYNEADEGTEMAIQITRDDAYIENTTDYLVPFVVKTAVNTDGKYTNLLDFLDLEAYQDTVGK